MVNVTNETLLMILKLRFDIYSIAIPFMIALCMAAILANVLVLISMRFIRVRLNPSLKLAFSLSAADAWNSLVLIVGLVANSYLPYVKFVPKFHRQDCILGYTLEALRTGAMTTSVLHLLTLSLTHYAAIAHPVTYRQWSFNKFRVNCAVVALWLVPPFGFLFVFLLYFDDTYNAVVCDGGEFLVRTGFRISVFLLIFLPLTFMIAVYVKIMTLLSALKFKNKPSVAAPPMAANLPLVGRQDHNDHQAAAPPSASAAAAAAHRRDIYVQRKMRMVITGMLIVSTFLIGWIPSSVLFALTCETCFYPQSMMMLERPRLLYTFAITVNCLIIVKGLLNPLIYCIRIPEIKDALKLTYGCCVIVCKRSEHKYSSENFESTYGDVSTILDGPSCDHL